MTSLQLGLFAAGAALVAGVLVYNWVQERRIRRQIDGGVSPVRKRGQRPGECGPRPGPHRAPTLPGAVPENAPSARAAETRDDEKATSRRSRSQNRIATRYSRVDEHAAAPVASRRACAPRAFAGAGRATVAACPITDIECLDPVAAGRTPVAAGARAAGLARPARARPLRWFGRRGRTGYRLAAASRPTRPDRVRRESSRACSSPTAPAPRRRAAARHLHP